MHKKTLPIIFFDIDFTLFDTQSFKQTNFKTYALYPEVLRVLKFLKGKVVLGIISSAKLRDKKFQVNKLIKCGIYKYFSKDKIFILSDPDDSDEHKQKIIDQMLSLHRGGEIVIVDDKLSVLRAAFFKNPQIKTLWIKRGPHAQNSLETEDFKPTASSGSLDKIIEIMDNLL